MRGLLIFTVLAGLIGFVAGNAFWYLASPLWIDVEVSESITAAETERVLARGNFADAVLHTREAASRRFTRDQPGRDYCA